MLYVYFVTFEVLVELYLLVNNKSMNNNTSNIYGQLKRIEKTVFSRHEKYIKK